MIADSIKAQLDEAKHVMRRQMARIAELEQENERLRSAAGGHEVFRSIYADANQPTGHRIKAAGLAIGHETPSLKPVEQPLDLVAEPVESIAVRVDRQRARMVRIHALPLEERSKHIAGVSGNGDASDDTAGLSCVIVVCSALRWGRTGEDCSVFRTVF